MLTMLTIIKSDPISFDETPDWCVVRGGRCSIFLTTQCLGDVLTKTLPYDVLDDYLKKPKHCASDAY